ncbi:6-phosphofructo-2-kinase/fructose-2_ 6-biphosphatase 1 [Caligus rogercresseyi]|uniref:6-phosphofructo-2-kinase/fructose-2_ 6-biphosphatase 1 n=1 Tax=Caligus rogercresseyi TaxID=217165 RepID=A0A7T8QW57_CALRO|nr:6-phosphofructo-2-kinase/fructose-2_ 6-biphosphatase 1 [Caligus rogercresseyi]
MKTSTAIVTPEESPMKILWLALSPSSWNSSDMAQLSSLGIRQCYGREFQIILLMLIAEDYSFSIS